MLWAEFEDSSVACLHPGVELQVQMTYHLVSWRVARFAFGTEILGQSRGNLQDWIAASMQSGRVQASTDAHK